MMGMRLLTVILDSAYFSFVDLLRDAAPLKPHSLLYGGRV